MTTTLYYLRFSSAGQKDGSSFERQQKLADKYRLKHSLPAPTMVYRDSAQSAFHEKNLVAQLGQMLLDIESNKYHEPIHVITESIDRISRGPLRSSQTTINRILARATLITTIDEKIYSEDDQSLETMLIQLVKSATAHEESLKRSERAKEHWAKVRTEGKLQNTVCPRYLLAKSNKSGYKKNPEDSKHLKLAFKLAEQGLGVTRISQAIYDKYKANWGTTTIQRALKDPRAHQYKIVSEEQFFRVQKLRTERRTSTNLTAKEEVKNPFKSLLVCECGGAIAYTAVSKKNPTWSDRMVCRQRHNYGKRKCPTGAYFNVNKLFPLLYDFFTTITPEFFIGERESIDELKRDLEIAQGKLAKAESKLDKILDLLDDEDTKIDTIKKKVEKSKSEVKVHLANVTRLEVEVKSHAETIEALEIPKNNEQKLLFNQKLLNTFGKITIEYPSKNHPFFSFISQSGEVMLIDSEYRDWTVESEPSRDEYEDEFAYE